jgi:CDP-4-dehydro-6-deoxyglucose reductase
MLNWNKVKIIKIESVTAQTSIFWAEVQDMNCFDFTPGQFITFDLPIHEKRNKRLRSYSIASAPNESNLLELIIGKVPHGLASEYFFNPEKCNPGIELDYRGPLGVFTLPNDLKKHHIFVCTGTGVAPFRSMIKHVIQSNIPFQSIDLVFGARTADDILYQDEFEQLAREIENFNYHVCLSREEYKGYKGYVHEVYQNVASTKNKKDVHFMFCGWREMIDQAREELSELNYTKDQIDFELYG